MINGIFEKSVSLGVGERLDVNCVEMGDVSNFFFSSFANVSVLHVQNIYILLSTCKN